MKGGSILSEKKELTAEELVEKITKESPQGGEFSLNDAIIKGKLDLRHRIITIAVTLTNCIFTDEVDLRYCEFKQCVDFSGSYFKKDFNSGDEAHSFTIYRKELICNDTVFEDGASFNGIQCEGSGYFNNARFENPEREIDFCHATFGVTLECRETIFQGGASFNSLQCKGAGLFHNAQFEKEIDFRHATFDVNLECQGAIFKGGVDFDSLQCKGGFFYNAKFENPGKVINFSWATFGVTLQCQGAIFKGGANFNSLQCEGGSFYNAKFENPGKEINFGHARFGHLDCQETIFKGGANFNSLQCEGGFFNNAKFENPKREINFAWATFSVNLECQGIMNNSDEGKTIFAGKVDFRNVQISGNAIFWKTEFRNSVNFNSVTIHSLSLMDPRTDYGSKSFPFEKEVDLRRCTFDIFEGTKEQQRCMVNAQSPEKFSQDPYLQFEKYYRDIGDEVYAKDVYYEGRLALRKNAWRRFEPRKSKRQERNSDIRWPWWKVFISEQVFRWMVGYGVRMRWPFICIATLLLFSTFVVFWSDDALVPKDVEGISALKSVVEQIVKADKAEQTGAKDNFLTHLCHRLWYSLDLFIPIVNLRIVDGYKRFHGGRAFYGVIHIVAGWILVPLLIASLSGVVKKYDKI